MSEHVSYGNEMPDCDCPVCSRCLVVDDYEELENGDTIECRHCHAEITLSDMEVVARFTLTAKGG